MQLSIKRIMGKNVFALGEGFQLPHKEKFIKCIFRIVLQVCSFFSGTQIFIFVSFVHASLSEFFSIFIPYFTISILTY